MKTAFEALSEFLATKTTHSTRAIEAELIAICNNSNISTIVRFANAASNFSKYCAANHITSWGRNQVFEWFSNQLNEAFIPGERSIMGDGSPPWEESETSVRPPYKPFPISEIVRQPIMKLFEQLEFYEYSDIIDHPLKNNVAYIELKRRCEELSRLIPGV